MANPASGLRVTTGFGEPGSWSAGLTLARTTHVATGRGSCGGSGTEPGSGHRCVFGRRRGLAARRWPAGHHRLQRTSAHLLPPGLAVGLVWPAGAGGSDRGLRRQHGRSFGHTGTTRSASAPCQLRPGLSAADVPRDERPERHGPHPPPCVPVTTATGRTPVHTEHCRAAPRDRRWPMAAISWTEEDCARRTHVFGGRVHRINARVYVRRSRRSWGGGRRGRAPCWRD